MNQQRIHSKMYSTEKRIVTIIIVIFNVSYLLRMVLEIVVFPKLFTLKYGS